MGPRRLLLVAACFSLCGPLLSARTRARRPVTFRWGVPPPSRAQPMPLWTRSWRVQPACHGVLDMEEDGAEAPWGSLQSCVALVIVFLPGPPPKRKALTLLHQ
ncbi:coagulation factor II thrombin receptor [Homo sapiens]|uniref:Coagulation factor II (Thrombin) receptor, isoform CRA_b n=2 Tax=Homininae TaxID=207598 RepID=G3XAL6_HUMAN|nr:coagulation factor II (thrombin) receptor, isoform CRA_b [Homo sapiens]KAI2537986.1 coagulation factor II thrombin receptor [Homo sapiens]KAI4021759.1 coagulation factor II thrombin receptor [Homo sapiens]